MIAPWQPLQRGCCLLVPLLLPSAVSLVNLAPRHHLSNLLMICCPQQRPCLQPLPDPLIPSSAASEAACAVLLRPNPNCRCDGCRWRQHPQL